MGTNYIPPTNEIDRFKSRLKHIATAAPSSGEPAWHFIERLQTVASQAVAKVEHNKNNKDDAIARSTDSIGLSGK